MAALLCCVCVVCVCVSLKCIKISNRRKGNRRREKEMCISIFIAEVQKVSKAGDSQVHVVAVDGWLTWDMSQMVLTLRG